MNKFYKFISAIIVIVIVLTLSFVIVPPVRADIFIVTTTADTLDVACGSIDAFTDLSSIGDGEVSLREAICATNNTLGIDTISLPAGTYTLTIANIDSGTDGDPDADPEFNNERGSLDINAVDLLGLSIQGAGAENTIIQACSGTDCVGIDRVFYINQYNHVVMSDLTIQNGYIDSTIDQTEGGGVHNFLGFLELYNVVVANNIVEPTSGQGGGGGIANYGTLMIYDSAIINNSAYVGGGIYTVSIGVTRIYNSTISGNFASVGGGIGLLDVICFTADTQVLMADETYKSIADVKAGDQVISFDFSTNRRIASTVTNISERKTHEYLRVNDLGVTSEHPFSLGDNQWIEAGNLQVGDYVFGDSKIEIKSIEHIQEISSVYNIEVEGTHNYFVYNGQNDFLVHNKLIASNSASPLDIYFSTIANNLGIDEGGGIIALTPMRLSNSILADNSTTFGTNPECAGLIESLGYNLIENISSECTVSGNTSGNINGFDPGLVPLADNGGSTYTHKLLFNSPAIDSADETACAGIFFLDQRGHSRPQDGNQDSTSICDIGSYEYDGPSPTFADVPFNAFAWAQIESIYAEGITNGCSASPLNYCPSSTVTRAQMAVFLMRGINGSSYTPPAATGTVFNDVAINSFAAAFIEAFANEGITGGCGSGNYCPNGLVTRAQMAVFLLKAKHGSSYTPPAATGTMFNDVAINSFAAAWIEQLATEGITGGCGSGNYCPNNSVTRAQMAVFLQKTFNLPLP